MDMASLFNMQWLMFAMLLSGVQMELVLKGKVKGQRNRGRPKRSWEKDVEDWMGASVWRVGRTAEDWLMYRRSIKAATSGNG